ncbi:hypothetical protein Bca52824_027803 [Brassica carinata]|uniref:Uncharacterized protein n=1 Tax=Brassica carinata TaxID=52824 RepID=A0A8X7VBA0_BRACI|nr:hypothetical protein Bca52824_027803 [Brassica carinata]
MSSMGANYAQLQVMQKKQKEKMMMKKRLEKERHGGVDGGESVGVFLPPLERVVPEYFQSSLLRRQLMKK